MILVFRFLVVLATVLTYLFVGIPLVGQDSNRIELQLTDQMTCESSVIRLGDLAVIRGAENSHWRSLSAIELFPTPADATRIHVRDVIERLSLRGVSVDSLRFVGNESTLVRPGTTRKFDHPVQLAVATTSGDSPPIVPEPDKIKRLIVDFLKRRASSDIAWQVSVDMRPEDAAIIGRLPGPFQISGITSPWAGNHQVTVRVNNQEQVLNIVARVQISSDTQVVSIARPVQRGDLIQESHLEIVPLTERSTLRNLVYRLEDLVGQQAKRDIGAGQFAQSSWFEKPRVIHRGDVVEVIIQRGSLQAKSRGVAKQDGAINDVIEVQAKNPDRSYHVVVVGPGLTTLSVFNSNSNAVRR